MKRVGPDGRATGTRASGAPAVGSPAAQRDAAGEVARQTVVVGELRRPEVVHVHPGRGNQQVALAAVPVGVAGKRVGRAAEREAVNCRGDAGPDAAERPRRGAAVGGVGRRPYPLVTNPFHASHAHRLIHFFQLFVSLGQQESVNLS